MVKKIVWLLAKIMVLVLMLAVFFELFLFVKAGRDLFFGVMNNKTDNFNRNFRQLKKVSGYFSNLTDVDDFFDHVPEILGRNGRRVYFMLFQNNMELRPTGGFMGSYAKVILENGGLKDIVVQDIYVPDGQIEGYVEPPAPIQQAFKQGWFRLRDANWDPDFPTAAKTIEWFFEKGKEEKADGIVAVNLYLISDLLEITGPLELPDYELTVNKENFYQIAQYYSEADFFPGSTQKANIMGALTKVMIEKIKKMESGKLITLMKIARRNIREKQILIHMNNPEVERYISKLGFDGSMKNVQVKKGEINDYFYMVEANLGVNKTNCCVERSVRYEIDIASEKIAKRWVKTVFRNTSKYFTPLKPSFLGGSYLNYLRFYLPSGSKNISVKVEGEKLPEENLIFEERKDLNVLGIGFFIIVPALSEKTVEIFSDFPVELPNGGKAVYKLTVQKQPGIKSLPFETALFKKGESFFILKEELAEDKEIEADIMYNE